MRSTIRGLLLPLQRGPSVGHVAGRCPGSPGPSESRGISAPHAAPGRAGFCSTRLSNFTDRCLEADRNRFRKVLHNPAEHVLHHLGYSRQFQPLPTVIPLGHAPTTA